jgi:hypothetical protein
MLVNWLQRLFYVQERQLRKQEQTNKKDNLSLSTSKAP